MSSLKPMTKFQIGKNGVTSGSIAAINSLLRHYYQVRIYVLQSAGRDREKMPEIEKEITSKIDVPIYSRIIGFSIIVNRLRTPDAKSSKKRKIVSNNI